MLRKIVRASSPETPPSGPREGVGRYRSHILRSFLQRMRRFPRVQLLDLGSLSGGNLEFFGRRDFKVFAEDLIGTLRAPAGPPPPARRNPRTRTIDMPAVQPLGFPDAHFQGALCWDVFDFLDRDEALLLARELHRILVPGGLALALFHFRRAGASEPVFRYRILDTDSLDVAPTGHRRLVRFAFANRDLMQVFSEFRIEGFFLLRNRIREVLAEKRPAPPSPASPGGAPSAAASSPDGTGDPGCGSGPDRVS